MNFIDYNLNLDKGDIVEVRLDKQANVRLLDPTNFTKYKAGRRHKYYYGGLAKASPVRIPAPFAGTWHLVIDLGGNAGTIRASVHKIKA